MEPVSGSRCPPSWIITREIYGNDTKPSIPFSLMKHVTITS